MLIVRSVDTAQMTNKLDEVHIVSSIYFLPPRFTVFLFHHVTPVLASHLATSRGKFADGRVHTVYTCRISLNDETVWRIVAHSGDPISHILVLKTHRNRFSYVRRGPLVFSHRSCHDRKTAAALRRRFATGQTMAEIAGMKDESGEEAGQRSKLAVFFRWTLSITRVAVRAGDNVP